MTTSGQLLLGDAVGPSRFDPLAAWCGDELVHVHRVPDAAAARFGADLARLPRDESVRAPRLTPGTRSTTRDTHRLAVLAVPNAVPLALVAAPGGWLTRAAAQAVLGDVAQTLALLHRYGVAAGWLGPEGVLVDAHGRASLDLALTMGHRRPWAGPIDDIGSFAVLAGWLAHRCDLRYRHDLAGLLDEAVLTAPGVGASDGGNAPRGPVATWLRRLIEATGQDVADRGPRRSLLLGEAADRELLDAVSERWRATVLSAPDRPAHGLSARLRLSVRARWSRTDHSPLGADTRSLSAPRAALRPRSMRW